MNKPGLKLNNFSIPKEYKLSPKDWVDNYTDEFFNEVFSLTNNTDISLTIVENAFSKAISKVNKYEGTEDEHTWLSKILFNEIHQKSRFLFHKSDFSLFFQKCLDGLPYIEKEVFRLKTLKKEKTENICKILNINEQKFWQHLNNARLSITHGI